MDRGSWVWPSDPRGQRKVLRTLSDSPQLLAALKGVARNNEGLTNSELDELLGDHSNWITLWSIRQLTALGFIEYRVDFFGGPAKYAVTDLGRSALSSLAGTPAQPGPKVQPAATAPQPQPPTLHQ